jgi:UTP--glucose-1-phosphate uridylyltransferase
LLIVEEALSAGIEEVCLIVQKGDEQIFTEFFNVRISMQNFNKLSTRFRAYSDYLSDVGRRIRFVVQEKQEGFGHAVYCAREWTGDEPFLLLLGDHLYRSFTDASCARQLLDVYEKHQLSAVGLMRAPEEAIGNFGTVAGEWIGDERVLSVTEFAEKPTVDYAREKLRVAGIEEDAYLTIFGQYVIRPEIFRILEEHIQHNVRTGGEIQLTSALDELRKREGFLGAMIDGRRYDIGTPEAYVQTLTEYAHD